MSISSVKSKYAPPSVITDDDTALLYLTQDMPERLKQRLGTMYLDAREGGKSINDAYDHVHGIFTNTLREALLRELHE